MLRKIVHITLTILLLLSTMGITISKHYCSNKLISQEINAEPTHCCEGDMSECKMCHTEHYRVKVEDDFQDNSHEFNFQQIAIAINLVYTLFNCEPEPENTQNYNNVESPPPLTTKTYLSLIQEYLC